MSKALFGSGRRLRGRKVSSLDQQNLTPAARKSLRPIPTFHEDQEPSTTGGVEIGVKRVQTRAPKPARPDPSQRYLS
jgi:hypothetical protein